MHAACHDRDPTTMESLQAHKVKRRLQPLQTLKRCSSQPQRSGSRSARKSKMRPLLKSALALITNLQTFVKARQDAWNIFELMELQEVLVFWWKVNY